MSIRKLYEEELKDELDFTDEELEEYVDSLEKELEDEDLEEAVMTVAQRRKRAMTFRRLAPRLKRKKEIAQRRMAPREKLEKRAAKAATDLIRKKFAGKQGEDYHTLSPAARVAIDKRIESKRGSIKNIARKILPKIKKKEVERLAKYKKNLVKEETIDEKFTHFLKEEGISFANKGSGGNSVGDKITIKNQDYIILSKKMIDYKGKKNIAFTVKKPKGKREYEIVKYESGLYSDPV